MSNDLRRGFERHRQQFIDSLERNEAICEDDKVWLKHKVATDSRLPGVWQASDFIAKICIAKPLLLLELLKSNALEATITPEAVHRRVEHCTASAEDDVQLHKQLRLARQQIMLILGWRDLAGLAEVEQTMAGVSALAEAVLGQALTKNDSWLSERFGKPLDASTGEPAKLIVLGLGKLGGGELNYSSDIDLIFSYSAAGSTAGTSQRGGLDNQEYFTRLGRNIIAALDPITEDGFVFRTDMRLRPNGDSGPLVLSFSAMEHYYQTHGRSWERYALIKARTVAGDLDLGAELLATLRPFVYRKYLDFGAFDSIREMKSMIERELKQAATQRDIKLGWGGIREIEFLIQSHQLIRGGRDKQLQTQSLYSAMDALQTCGVLEAEVVNQLTDAYRFFRNVEHRLQMVADRQTQLLPDEDLAKLRLARSMGFDNWDKFKEVLGFHRNAVHHQFRAILEDPARVDRSADTQTNGEAREKTADDIEAGKKVEGLMDIWSGKSEETTMKNVLIETGFSETEATKQLIDGFRHGRLYQSFSNIERDRIDRLMPQAMIEAGRHAQAQRALAAFISILESIGRRTAYLSLLIENPIALRQLLHLCAASPWIARHIGQHPVILDELLQPIVDIRQFQKADVEAELEQRLTQLDDHDEEGWLNTLREYHHAQVLRIASADVSGILSVDEIHLALTSLAEQLLLRVFDEAIRYTQRKRGDFQAEAGIIAYGKFAAGELGYHSDLDLVICFDYSAENISNGDAEYFFSHVGRRLIHLLTVRTHAGSLYELDMRLRPSGRSGTLVTSLKGFFDYQKKQAWTWEHQALVRARPVVGSEQFKQSFEQQRSQIICLKRNKTDLVADVKKMRRKMIDANCQSTDTLFDIKLGEGGIVDIEFLVQFWVLLHAHEFPRLACPRASSDIIAQLIESGVISSDTGTHLVTCYETYLRRSLDLKLMNQPVLVDQSELKDQTKQIRAIWDQTFG